MSSKEIKSRLKAAKAAVEEKDFEKALKQCQILFQVDAQNYNGQVFAGLACLQLGKHQESKAYYRSAITQQPDGPLAWKGLADYYDKHRPVTQDEQRDAIDTYTRLLTFVESNTSKKRSTLWKLLSLHKELNHHDKVFHCYSELVDSIESTKGVEPVATATEASTKAKDSDDSAAVSQIWVETTVYLLEERELTEGAWSMLENTYQNVPEDDLKSSLRVKFTRKFFRKFMMSEVLDDRWKQLLVKECFALVSTHPQVALPMLVQLGLMDIIKPLREDWTSSHVTLSDINKEWFSQYHSLLEARDQGSKEDSFSDRDVSLGWAGLAAVLVAEGKWKEAKEAVSKAVVQSEVPSECRLLTSYILLRLHDYHASEVAARKGIESVSKSARFLKSELEYSLKLLHCKACLGTENVQCLPEAVNTLLKLDQDVFESQDCHVTMLLFRAYLLQGDVEKATMTLQKLMDSFGPEHVQVLILEAELHVAKKDYHAALSRVESALTKEPESSHCLFLKGNILWQSSDSNKKPAYAALIQAGKADPYNPKVFLLLGHYQREMSKDLKRAAKCYQKVLDIQPTNTEAAMCLGDVLTASGEEDRAFEVYSKVVAVAVSSSAKLAWLRMGLYQRKKEQHTEAINSFQNVLAIDSTDPHCWECLGEAYMARGSYNSALRTFQKALELEPNSLYSFYQIACIKLILGEPREAVCQFSVVLEKEPSYVPALKGRGEGHLHLSRQALQLNFDGKAVDHVSLALQDLVRALQLRPHFVSLLKLIGDCLTSLHVLSPNIARPRVPKLLCGENSSSPDETRIVDKVEALQIGCRAYAKAVQYCPESASLWHDLAVGYLYVGQSTKKGVDSDREMYFTNALNTVKKALSLCPNNHQLWTTLGVIAATPEINSPSLAQHAFIKSIQQEQNNATAWANLGALYLTHNNIKLAYEAFKNAQGIAPDCIEAWIGQAVVAESIGDKEAMDLFRHSTELGYHAEGSAGYGYWVCQSLTTIDPRLILIPGQGTLNSIALTGLLQARDGLQKHALRENDDPCALNYLGLLYEREGLVNEAGRTFQKALESAVSFGDDKLVCMIKVNYARVLSVQGRISEALEQLQSATSEDCSDFQFQLALTLFRKLNYLESNQVYQQLLEDGPTSKNDSIKSTILCAQAMVAFAQGKRDSCKTFLFKAFQTPPVSVHGLVALCALGCLSDDLTLIQAAVMETEKILAGSMTGEVLHPTCIEMLNVIQFILQDNTQAQECVQTLESVLQRLPKISSNDMMPLPLPLMLRVLKASTDKASSRIAVQKLVHAYPSDVWTLATLTSLLGDKAGDLMVKYQQLVLLHIMDNIDELSTREVQSGIEKSYQSTLSSLQRWALASSN